MGSISQPRQGLSSHWVLLSTPQILPQSLSYCLLLPSSLQTPRHPLGKIPFLCPQAVPLSEGYTPSWDLLQLAPSLEGFAVSSTARRPRPGCQQWHRTSLKGNFFSQGLSLGGSNSIRTPWGAERDLQCCFVQRNYSCKILCSFPCPEPFKVLDVECSSPITSY